MSTIAVTNLKHESASGNNITLDSSGNVGVGQSSPGATLDIIRSGTGQVCQFTNTNASWAADVVTTYAPSGVTASSFGISARSDATTWVTSTHGAMIFRTGTSGSASERMRIDSAGRVTMPYQPVFSVTRTAGDTAANTVHVGNLVLVNVGGHYNTSNGRFTAPVTGVYAFHCYFMASGSTNDTAIAAQFFKNGVALNNSVPYTRANGESFQGMAGHVIVDLTVNDYIELRNSGSTGWYGTGTGHNAFSGQLIG